MMLFTAINIESRIIFYSILPLHEINLATIRDFPFFQVISPILASDFPRFLSDHFGALVVLIYLNSN